MLGVWRSRLHALLQGPRAGWNHRPTSEIQRPAWTLSAARLFASSGGGSEREKVAVELREEDLVESFVKGWGKGGQKINKVRNCVLLKHVPTGLHVRCQETRSLDGNRRIARRLLLQKLDDQLNGDLSKRNVKINKLHKKKANRRNKSRQKYASSADPDSDSSDSEDEEEEEGEDGVDEYDEEDEVDVVEFDVEEHKFRPQKKK